MSAQAIDLAPALAQDAELSNLETRIGHLLRKTICSIKSVSNLQQVTSLVISLDLYVLHPCFAEMVNLEHLAITGCILRRLEHLNSLPKLKSLDFSNNRLTDTQGLEHISSLESLKLDHNPISRLSPSFLATLPSLRKLSLCGTSISGLLPTVEALKGLPNLEVLSFRKDYEHEADDASAHEEEEDADDQASNASAATAASNASAVTAASNTSGTTAASGTSVATTNTSVSAFSTFSTLAHRDENDVSDDDDFQNYSTGTASSDEDSEEEPMMDLPEDNDLGPPNLWNKPEQAPTPITTYPYYREYLIAQLPKLRVLDKVVIGPADRERARNVVRDKFELKADDPYRFLGTKNAFPQNKPKPTPANPPKSRSIHFKSHSYSAIPHTHSHSHAHTHAPAPTHAHTLAQCHSHHENHEFHTPAHCTHSHTRSHSQETHDSHLLYTNNEWEETENNPKNVQCNSIPPAPTLIPDNETSSNTTTNNPTLNTNNLTAINLNAINLNAINLNAGNLNTNILNNNVNNPNPEVRSTNKFSKLLLGREMGPMKGPVFKRGILSEKMSDMEIGRAPKMTVHHTAPFIPRQFEYHPTISEYALFGSTQGDVVIINQFSSKVICSANARNQTNILGLCWLHNDPMKFLAGSDNGAVSMYDVRLMQEKKNPVSFNFPEFADLTSVHANCTDTLFAASGYSHDVGLFDLVCGKQLSTFKEVHSEHINVIKFSNHNPNLFATSSFDRMIKLWDLRLPPLQPVYARESKAGNVVVVFSPDDKYLLASAVDNEIRQYVCGDGRLHTLFDTPKRNSQHNYTRSYYMNSGEYVIVGSCDENIVRVYNAGTGRLFREVEMAQLPTQYGTLYIQSLRGDPLLPFNFTVLVSYNPAVISSRLVHVSLLDTDT
eukprot:Phypoly_transcript_02463.p1 GENE.Phypoly_transcript_02463~~Phypoly_transcript_02463.p1  ORF type:complete len:915 (+),score=141.40 Phypoly_transcript_02463:75-2747(+)